MDVLCKNLQAHALGIVLEFKRGVELENTTAGCVLTAELRRREKRRHEQMEEEEEERLLQARVAETQARLKQVERRNRAEAEQRHHRRQGSNRDLDRDRYHSLARDGPQVSWFTSLSENINEQTVYPRAILQYLKLYDAATNAPVFIDRFHPNKDNILLARLASSSFVSICLECSSCRNDCLKLVGTDLAKFLELPTGICKSFSWTNQVCNQTV